MAQELAMEEMETSAGSGKREVFVEDVESMCGHVEVMGDGMS